jgi:hypothetical protein
MDQILNITANLAFIHRLSRLNSDHRNRRAIAHMGIVLIRNLKGKINQCRVVEQAVSVHQNLQQPKADEMPFRGPKSMECFP